MKKALAVLAGVFLIAQIGLSYESADVVSANCSQKQELKADCSKFSGGGHAKNVIIFIGDGMGLNAIYSARVLQNGPQEPLELEQMAHKTLIKTCSLSGLTDSAAAGTALATGYKTYNAQIGTGPDGKGLEDILDLAKKSGKATGLVTTDMVVGATPATFALHQDSRFTFRSLAEEYCEVKPEVLMGGGKDWFSKKGDRPDLIERERNGGYEVILDRSALPACGQNGKPVLGLFSDTEMTYEFDRKADCSEPHLYEMTQKALDVLAQDPDGFFLMVEGARIDHASHNGDFNRMRQEVLGLDQAVKVAKDFQAQHPDTLILITSDHETGGLKVKPGDYKKGDTVKYTYTTKLVPGIPAMHSTQKVALFGQGPGSEEVEKADDNTPGVLYREPCAGG